MLQHMDQHTNKKKRYTGYWALCAAINRALEEGINLMDPNYVKDIDISTLATVFRSATEHQIPLLDERHRILKEQANILIEVKVHLFVDNSQYEYFFSLLVSIFFLFPFSILN